MNFRLSVHALDVAGERDIPLPWITLAIESAQLVQLEPDGTTHYLKAIPQFGGRVLRVVLSTHTVPPLLLQCSLTGGRRDDCHEAES